MPKLPATADVVIAGAGPTGLALAGFLRAGGVRVLLVDRAPRRTTEARASVLHSRGIEILDTLGAAGPLVDEGVPIDSAAYYDNISAFNLASKKVLGISQVAKGIDFTEFCSFNTRDMWA